MKKIIYMLAAASLLFACEKESRLSESSPEGQSFINGNTISFNVEVEPQTKATISSDTDFTWEESDRAAVYASDGNKYVLTPSNISGGSATFSGEVPSGVTVSEDAIVVYPAVFLTGANQVTFPDSYTTSGQGTVLAAKVASGRKLSFKYLAATIKATITDVPIIASSITVSSTAVLTGEHTIDFSSSTPSMTTGSEAKTVTFSSPSGGSNTLIVPVPTTGSPQTITYKVKYGENDLFTKSTTKTLARNTYMVMQDVEITPTVYLYSNMTGWGSDDANRLQMTVSEGVASCSINALKDQYFRFYLVSGDVNVELGPATSINTNTTIGDITTNVTSWDSKSAVKVHDAIGTYTITYDYTTGKYGISQTSTSPTLYAVGAINEWSLSNTDYPLTKTGKWYYILGVNKIFKINYSGYQSGKWNGVFGYDNSSVTNATPSISGWDFGNSSSDNNWYYASLLYDSAANRYWAWADGKDNTESFSKLYIKGSWDSYSTGIEMTKSANNTHVWTISRAFTANQTFKVTDGDKAWWGYENNMESIYENTVKGDSDDQLKITVAGTYLIMFNDKTNKYHIIKTD